MLRLITYLDWLIVVVFFRVNGSFGIYPAVIRLGLRLESLREAHKL